MRDEGLVAYGIVDDAEEQLRTAPECQRDREVRVRVGEVGGAVERIEVPHVAIDGRRLERRAGGGFLRDHDVVGKRVSQVTRHHRLDRVIGLGDEIDVALVADRFRLAPRRAQQRSRLVDGSARDALERFHGRGVLTH